MIFFPLKVTGWRVIIFFPFNMISFGKHPLVLCIIFTRDHHKLFIRIPILKGVVTQTMCQGWAMPLSCVLRSH